MAPGEGQRVYWHLRIEDPHPTLPHAGEGKCVRLCRVGSGQIHILNHKARSIPAVLETDSR